MKNPMNRKTAIALSVVGAAALVCMIAAVVHARGPAESRGRLSSLYKRVAIVRIEGPIFDSDPYVRQIRHFGRERSIAGLLLIVNSPGGGVAPSQEIYREVQRFRDGGKTVVVSMGGVAASGGYYIAAAGATIFANPGTLTGSIGVIMESPHYYKLLGKIGVQIETLKAGKYKDIGSPTRDMTAEERTLLQSVLDDTHLQFVEDVAAGRHMNIDSVKAVADGRIFTGRQALKAGLVDTLGSYVDALDFLRKECGLSDQARAVERRARKQSLLESIITEDLFGLSGLLASALSQTMSSHEGLFYLYRSH